MCPDEHSGHVKTQVSEALDIHPPTSRAAISRIITTTSTLASAWAVVRTWSPKNRLPLVNQPKVRSTERTGGRRYTPCWMAAS